MPKYRKDGIEVEDPSGGLREFYEGHGFALVADGSSHPEKVTIKKGAELRPPSDLGQLADNISKGEGD